MHFSPGFCYLILVGAYHNEASTSQSARTISGARPNVRWRCCGSSYIETSASQSARTTSGARPNVRWRCCGSSYIETSASQSTRTIPLTANILLITMFSNIHNRLSSFEVLFACPIGQPNRASRTSRPML
jgi:uncharacterized protein (DUF2237 family)